MINLTQGRRLQARDLQHTLKSFNTLKTGSAAERETKAGQRGCRRLRGGTSWLLVLAGRCAQPGFLLIASKGHVSDSGPAPNSHRTHPMLGFPMVLLQGGC